jgi:hypothetical protein
MAETNVYQIFTFKLDQIPLTKLLFPKVLEINEGYIKICAISDEKLYEIIKFFKKKIRKLIIKSSISEIMEWENVISKDETLPQINFFREDLTVISHLQRNPSIFWGQRNIYTIRPLLGSVTAQKLEQVD